MPRALHTPHHSPTATQQGAHDNLGQGRQVPGHGSMRLRYVPDERGDACDGSAWLQQLVLVHGLEEAGQLRLLHVHLPWPQPWRHTDHTQAADMTAARSDGASRWHGHDSTSRARAYSKGRLRPRLALPWAMHGGGGGDGCPPVSSVGRTARPRTTSGGTGGRSPAANTITASQTSTGQLDVTSPQAGLASTVVGPSMWLTWKARSSSVVCFSLKSTSESRNRYDCSIIDCSQRRGGEQRGW